MWFFYELAAWHPNAAKGIVRYIPANGVSLWDPDLESEWAASRLEKIAFPVSSCATHVCSVPRLVSLLLNPISIAQADKGVRNRSVFHNCAPGKIVHALSEYGIPPNMILTELGGTYVYDFKKIMEKLKQLDEKIFAERDEFDWASIL